MLVFRRFGIENPELRAGIDIPRLPDRTGINKNRFFLVSRARGIRLEKHLEVVARMGMRSQDIIVFRVFFASEFHRCKLAPVRVAQDAMHQQELLAVEQLAFEDN